MKNNVKIHFTDSTLRNIIAENDDGEVYIEGPNRKQVFFRDIEFDLITTSLSTLDVIKGLRPNDYESFHFEEKVAYFCIGITTKEDFILFQTGESKFLHTMVFSFDNINDFSTALYILNTFVLIIKYNYMISFSIKTIIQH